MTKTLPHFIYKALVVMTVILSSGCQLTSNNINSHLSYGEYYLSLQQLNQLQLTDEIEKQQVSIEQIPQGPATYNAQIKLLLLYSHPKSPIYNSFHAKVLLNQLKAEQDNAAFVSITPDEQAFISLLHDQLNQRLLMRNRMISQHKEQQESLQKTAQTQQQHAIKIQQRLTEQVKLLEQTIKQLQDIEQAIDKRDQ